MFSEGGHGSPAIDKSRISPSREELISQFKVTDLRSVLLSSREAPVDFSLEQMREKDRVAM